MWVDNVGKREMCLVPLLLTLPCILDPYTSCFVFCPLCLGGKRSLHSPSSTLLIKQLRS